MADRSHHADEREPSPPAPPDNPKAVPLIPGTNIPIRLKQLGPRGCTHRCECGAVLRCADADRCEVPEPFRCPTCRRRDEAAELDAMAKYYGADQ